MLAKKNIVFPIRNTQRGVALIIVLGCVVLITVLIVAFFNRASTDLQSSKAYSDNHTVQMMTDIPVNIVMAQIRHATTSGPNGTAWASQPGMIRTFDNTGALLSYYKLYSSPAMTGSQVNPANELTAMANWSSQPACFTDLNEPVTTGTVSAYPILTPPSGNIDGYCVTSAPVASGTNANPVPLPTSWLYMLQDGSLIAPDPGGSGTTATFATASTIPNSSNPIVGRIAFWTDDETCKVNINTAGGDGIGTGTTASGTGTDPTNIANATFWDSPRFCAPDELNLAQCQPASGEFQRYPGHPATVALNNILNGLGWINLSSTNFYSLTPRYANGGSKSGTVSVASGTSIPLGSNRLYSSVDEMLFSGTSRNPSVINKTNAATQQQMAAAHFFLTAHSRAPELNLFGQPRISIWPVWDSSKVGTTPWTASGVASPVQRTAIDQLLAFCATSGSNPYYFTRADNSSAYTDVALARNQQLLGYLDYFTSVSAPIPGFGGYFQSASKYGQQGSRQILTEIFDYIRTINEVDSSTGATVYGQQWNRSSASDLGFAQVAPTIMSSSNSGLSSSLKNWNTQGEGFYPRLTEATLQFIAIGRGALSGSAAILPQPAYNSLSNCVPGDFGTNPTNSGTTTNTLTLSGTIIVPPGNTAAGSQPTMAIQALLLLHFVNPAETRLSNPATAGGDNTVHPFIAVEVTGLDGLTLTGTNTPNSLGFPNDDSMIIGTTGANFSSGPFFSVLGIRSMMTQIASASTGRTLGNGYTKTGGSATNKYTAAYKNFPFYSKIIPIAIQNSGSGTMTLNGATIKVMLYDGSAHATGSTLGNLVQTYTIQIPSGTFPVPTPDTTGTLGPPIVGLGKVGSVSPKQIPDIWWPGSSDSNQAGTGGGLLIRNGLNSNQNAAFTFGGTIPAVNATLSNGQDTVESMVLSGSGSQLWSDPRLLAVNDIPVGAFTQHPNWGQAMAHSLCYGAGTPLPGATANGALAQNAAYNTTPGNSTSTTPIVLSSINGATTSSGAPGDWDNGLGNDSDGPWINKADEGEVYASGSVLNLPYFATAGKTIVTGSAFFSPNREVPSPGMFGSLPTGIDPLNPKPWQTLLFRPGPSGHPGAISPPDHLLLDLFWMPVAEPYAISEPFSSAGKINLNYQIMPYTYITRSAALRAVIGTEKVAAVDVSQSKLSKVSKYDGTSANPGMTGNARHSIDLDVTLAQCDSKFASGDIFRSASQICDIYLVPKGMGYATAAAFASDWYGNKFALVGDNVRERPYTDIYGRVTTKSNTYQVHYRVQSLQKIKTDPNQARWVEGKDLITGEKRGSTIIERYIDPNAGITDFAANPNVANSLEGSYKFRILSITSFHP